MKKFLTRAAGAAGGRISPGHVGTGVSSDVAGAGAAGGAGAVGRGPAVGAGQGSAAARRAGARLVGPVFAVLAALALVLGLSSAPISSLMPPAQAQTTTNFPVSTTSKGQITASSEGEAYLEQTATGVFTSAGTVASLQQNIKNTGSKNLTLVNFSVSINDELLYETNPEKVEGKMNVIRPNEGGPMTVQPNLQVAAGSTVTIRYLYKNDDISTALGDLSATGVVDETGTTPTHPEPVRTGDTWKLYDDTVTTVTPGNNPKVTITHPITSSGVLQGITPDEDAEDGYLWAYLEAQNGYDLDGSKNVVIRVLDTAGREVYRNVTKPDAKNVWPVNSNNESAGYTNGYGGIADAKLPVSNIEVKEGYKIVVELQFKHTGGTTVVDSTFKGPVGPGYVKYKISSDVPVRCEQSPFKDSLGDSAPRTNKGKQNRQPARELTEAERARGTSVYVTASTPGPGQKRRYSTLYRQDELSDQFTKVNDLGGWVVNALAYNQKDNYLYAISQGRVGVKSDGKDTEPINRHSIKDEMPQLLHYEDPCYPAGHLLQINPETGELFDLGKVTGAAGTTAKNTVGYGFQGESGYAWPNDLWGGINVGFFDAKGNYWVSNGSQSGTGALYKVNLNDVNAYTEYEFSEDPLKDRRDYNDLGLSSSETSHTSSTKWRAASEDYSIIHNADGNYAWGLVNWWNSSNSTDPKAQIDKVYIERINLDSGESKVFDITSLADKIGDDNYFANSWSKAWVYADGTLGFGTGSYGANSNVIKIKVTNPADDNPEFALAGVFSGAPQAYNTNGTSNSPAGFSADLETTKRFDKIEDGRIYWWIDAWNNGPDGLSGFTLDDKTTDDFTDLKVEQISQADGLNVPNIQTVENNSIHIQFGRLPARASGNDQPQISVQVSAQLASTANGQCVANTVSVTNNENDPKVDNNTFTALCDIAIEKSAVDVNEDGEINEKDVQGPANGVYTVSYDVTVKNKSSDVENTYTQVKDIVSFPEPFTVQSVSVQRPGNDGKPTGNFAQIQPTETNGTTYVLGGPGKLAGGATDTYRVQVTFTADKLKLSTNPDLGKCSDKNTGLYNVAQVGGEKDDACVPFPTTDKMPLKIVKLEANGDETPIPGAEFALYKAAGDGSFVQSEESKIEVNTDGQGNFTAEIDAPGVYWLVETKAPAGLSLLAEPVKFISRWDESSGSKQPVIEVQQGGSSLIKTSIETAGTTGTQTFAVLKVADVKNGELPKTGGLGIWLFAVAGLLICAVGGVVAVRRK